MEYEYTWPVGEKLVYLRPPNEFYDGKLAPFYHSSCFPELNELKENWKIIRDEILDYEHEFGNLKGMNSLSPADVSGGVWTVIYLNSFGRLFKQNRKKFPKTIALVDKVENCVFASINILEPGTVIQPHYGDTNGIVRVHLGLIVPDPYPVIGIHVGDEEMGWEEGDFMCFINVQKHHVWSHSKEKRYVLMMDIVPKPLMHRKLEICLKGLGSQSFNYFYKNHSWFRIFPTFLQPIFVFVFTAIWRAYLPIERFFNR
jgi:aspartyl/asparaginyl beta-hydroxylase (cupin superfamily)